MQPSAPGRDGSFSSVSELREANSGFTVPVGFLLKAGRSVTWGMREKEPGQILRVTAHLEVGVLANLVSP
jgi:hypothetical protein